MAPTLLVFQRALKTRLWKGLMFLSFFPCLPPTVAGIWEAYTFNNYQIIYSLPPFLPHSSPKTLLQNGSLDKRKGSICFPLGLFKIKSGKRLVTLVTFGSKLVPNSFRMLNHNIHPMVTGNAKGCCCRIINYWSYNPVETLRAWLYTEGSS